MTEDDEDLPLCGGGGTEDDENSKVGSNNNKEQDQPLPLHGGGVTEDDEDLKRLVKFSFSSTVKSSVRSVIFLPLLARVMLDMVEFSVRV